MLTKISHDLLIREPGDPLDITAQEPDPKRATANQKRSFNQAANAFEKHKHGMIAGYIISPPIFHQVTPKPVSLPGSAMVRQFELRKRGGGPAEHIRFDLIQGIPPGSPDKAADVFPTLSPIDLGGPPNMEDWIDFGFYFECATDLAANCATTNPQFRVGLEPLEALLEVVGGKR